MNTLDYKGYSVEVADEQHQVDRVVSIFASNGNPKKKAHIDWQYLNSPGGGAYTAFAVSHAGQDAAVYSVFKVKAKIHGEIRDVCQSLDTLTDKDHRGKGLFPVVASKVFDQCDKDGVDFIYGFPNSSSAPGFFNKLGWKKIGLPPFIFYMNNLLFPIAYLLKRNLFIKNYFFWVYLLVINFLRKRMGRFQVLSDIDFKCAEYDALWRKFSEKISVSIWRDSEYMEWRYREKPEREYFCISVKKDGVLLGVLVYFMANKHNGRIGYIMDVIFDPDFPQAGKLLVSEAVLAMSDLGADVVLAWSSPSFRSHVCYSASLFFSMPRSIQPIKLFFGYRPNLASKPVDIAPSDFYISYADSDTV